MSRTVIARRAETLIAARVRRPPRRALRALLVIAAVCSVAIAEAQPLSSPVQDDAQLFTAAERDGLAAELERLRSDHGIWFVVHTRGSLQGESIETYAARYFKQHAIGQRGEDNGLLLVLALAERRSRLEVGYGLEETVTDARSHQLLVDVLQPRMREGRPYDGVRELIRELRGEGAVDEAAASAPFDSAQPADAAGSAGAVESYELDRARDELPVPLAFAIAFVAVWTAIFVFTLARHHQAQRALLEPLVGADADAFLRRFDELRFFVILLALVIPAGLYAFAWRDATRFGPDLVPGFGLIPIFVGSSIAFCVVLVFARGFEHLAFYLSVKYFAARVPGARPSLLSEFNSRYNAAFASSSSSGGSSSRSFSISSSSRSTSSSSSSRSFSGGGRSGGGGASSGW